MGISRNGKEGRWSLTLPSVKKGMNKKGKDKKGKTETVEHIETPPWADTPYSNPFSLLFSELEKIGKTFTDFLEKIL